MAKTITATIEGNVFFNCHGYYANARFSDGKRYRFRCEVDGTITCWRKTGEKRRYDGSTYDIEVNQPITVARADAIRTALEPLKQGAEIMFGFHTVVEEVARMAEAQEGIRATKIKNAAPQMFDALLAAQLGLTELCHDQHPDNECWNILRQVTDAITAATAN